MLFTNKTPIRNDVDILVVGRGPSGVAAAITAARKGRRERFVPNIGIECTDRQCMLNYVENNLGLTIGSQNSLQEHSQKGIAALNISDFNEQQLVYVYFQKDKIKNSALNCFIVFLKDKIRI